MNPLLILHVLAVGVWIGVIIAETVIELDGKQDDSSHIKASKLHFLTDIWVEIPAFTTVLITGGLMLTKTHFSGLFLLKLLCGLFAIAANIVCVYGVFIRNKHARVGNITGVKAAERVLLRGGIGFIPSFIAAIVIAAYLII